MNDVAEALIPALAVSLIFSIVFGFFAYMRYLRYKETIALAERGLLRERRRRNGRTMLKWGILITSVGVGLSCIMLMGIISGDEGAMIFGAIVGFVPICVGIGMIIIDYVTRKDNQNGDDFEDEIELDPIPPNKIDTT